MVAVIINNAKTISIQLVQINTKSRDAGDSRRTVQRDFDGSAVANLGLLMFRLPEGSEEIDEDESGSFVMRLPNKSPGAMPSLVAGSGVQVGLF